MTWAGERRLQYIGGVMIFAALVTGAVYWRYFKKAPMCTDGIQNGTETGIDCGGICSNYCKNDIADPKIIWHRSFTVTPTASTAVAYITHGYAGASTRNVKYRFELFDANENVLATRDGNTFIGTVGNTAIVEPLIQVAGAQVARVKFSILGNILWEKTDPTISSLVIKTDINTIEPFSAGTRVRSLLENKTDVSFSNIPVAIILYDKDDNAIASSVANLPDLPANQNKEVVFTWPDMTLAKQIVHIEVLPRINPFTLQK